MCLTLEIENEGLHMTESVTSEIVKRRDGSEIKREMQDSKTVIFLFSCSILLFVYIFKY